MIWEDILFSDCRFTPFGCKLVNCSLSFARTRMQLKTRKQGRTVNTKSQPMEFVFISFLLYVCITYTSWYISDDMGQCRSTCSIFIRQVIVGSFFPLNINSGIYCITIR